MTVNFAVRWKHKWVYPKCEFVVIGHAKNAFKGDCYECVQIDNERDDSIFQSARILHFEVSMFLEDFEIVTESVTSKARIVTESVTRKCAVCGNDCSPRSKTCSAKCRKQLSRMKHG